MMKCVVFVTFYVIIDCSIPISLHQIRYIILHCNDTDYLYMYHCIYFYLMFLFHTHTHIYTSINTHTHTSLSICVLSIIYLQLVNIFRSYYLIYAYVTLISVLCLYYHLHVSVYQNL